MESLKVEIDPKTFKSNSITITSQSKSSFKITESSEKKGDCLISTENLDNRILFSKKQTLTQSSDCKIHCRNVEQNGENKSNVNLDKLLPVCCKECGRVFENAHLLSRHRLSTHLPEELKVPCPCCGRRFSKRCNMYTHMRKFHGPDSVDKMRVKITAQDGSDLDQRKLYQCLQCPRKYTNKYKLNAHTRHKHSGITNGISVLSKLKDIKAINGDDNVNCKSNLLITSNMKSNYSVQTQIAHKLPKVYNYRKRFLCTICGIALDSQSALTIHMRRHTGEKPFKCDLCNKAYPRMYDVRIHRRVHTGEKPFKCPICQKAFQRSHKMKEHMRTHTNERPYKCSSCDRRFKQSKDLNIHMRIHTGERPYLCDVCGNTFTQSNSLKAHRAKYDHQKTPKSEPILTATETIMIERIDELPITTSL